MPEGRASGAQGERTGAWGSSLPDAGTGQIVVSDLSPRKCTPVATFLGGRYIAPVPVQLPQTINISVKQNGEKSKIITSKCWFSPVHYTQQVRTSQSWAEAGQALSSGPARNFCSDDRQLPPSDQPTLSCPYEKRKYTLYLEKTRL